MKAGRLLEEEEANSLKFPVGLRPLIWAVAAHADLLAFSNS